MILIFLGPPGAGKGTQAKFISNELDLVHLSTGAILRNQLLKKNELSIKLKTIMDSGQLVSDNTLNQIIAERIEEDDCKKGFILDGYPRTMAQVFFFKDLLSKKKLEINCIFEISIGDETIIRRIKERASNENREDDSIKSIKTRLIKYYNETKAVSDYYKKKFDSIYNFIDGDQEITNLNIELLKLVKKH